MHDELEVEEFILSMPIPGWDGYCATRDGRIAKIDGRILAQYREKNGYARVSLIPRTRTVVKLGVHQLVCAAFHGPKPVDKTEVRHLDGDRSNNHANNLKWATRQENSDDRKVHGTVPCGSRNGQSKLTENAIYAIITARSWGLTYKQIANRYGVSQAVIYQIITGRSWKHVPRTT